MARRIVAALSLVPLAALAESPPPVALEFLEFLAEEPAGVDGMEEALMSREIDRVLAQARTGRKAPEDEDAED